MDIKELGLNISVILIVLFILLLVAFVLLAPLIVAIFVANWFGVHGLTWAAIVIVLYVIEIGIITFLYS